MPPTSKTTFPELLAIKKTAGDPDPVPNQVIFYSKDNAGVATGYLMLDDGTVVQIGGGGGGGTAPNSNYLFFRPGSGQTGPVVFDDFNALYARLGVLQAASPGIYYVVVDDGDASPAILDSGSGDISYDFTNVRFRGIHEHAKTEFHIKDGGGETDSLTITNMLWFEGLIVKAVGQDTAIDAQADNKFYLLRTDFVGVDEYVVDTLGVSGVEFYLDHESSILKDTVSAMRVNSATIDVHLIGNNTTVNTRAILSGVGGHMNLYIHSSSAKVDQDQLEITVDSWNMLTASGYYNADPNTKVTAEMGVQVYDSTTGKIWVNTDAGTTWAQLYP